MIILDRTWCAMEAKLHTCTGAGVQAGQQGAGALAGVVLQQLQVRQRRPVEPQRRGVQLRNF